MALEAAKKVYDFCDGGLIEFENEVLPTESIDCDWVQSTLIPEAKKFEAKHPVESRYGWWRTVISVCKTYPAPKGYRVSKFYTGIAGTQIALYNSESGGPPVLAFAGTQNTFNYDDWKADLERGYPQLKEIVRMREGVREEEDWHFFADVGEHTSGDNNRKFDMSTNDPSKTLVNYLARILIENGDVIITGHSLGGALAQSAAYLVQRRAQELSNKTTGTLHVVTWNGLGGTEALEKHLTATHSGRIDETIVKKIRFENRYVDGDIVAELGTQLGGSRMAIPNQENGFFSAVTPKYRPTKYHSVSVIEGLFREQHCGSPALRANR